MRYLTFFVLLLLVSQSGWASKDYQGHWDNRDKIIWTNRSGDCWKNRTWKEGLALEQCDPDLIKKETVVAKAHQVTRPAVEPTQPMPSRVVLHGVHFDYDKSNIRGQDRPILDEAVSILKGHPEISVMIEGHTDSRGTDSYNHGLGQRRADSVGDYLSGHGVSGSSVRGTRSFGESQPVGDNNTESGRAQNRRVEFDVKQ